MRPLRFFIHPFPADPHIVLLWVCPRYPFSRPLSPDLPEETAPSIELPIAYPAHKET